MSKNMNVPKLRFSEFGGEWEVKPLSQVSGMKAGKFVKASDISDSQEDEMYPCYGGNGLRGYVKSHTHNGTYSLIGRQGALCGNVQLASRKFHATEHAVVVTPIYENDTLWLYYELERLNLNRFATGQAQPGLSVEVIQQVKTNIPLKPEQEKIASFLTSVDTRIEQLIKKEALLQEYKKGVMNKIFSQEIRFKDDDGSEFPEWEEKKLGDITEIIMGQSPSSNSYNLDNNGIPLIQGNADIQNRLTNPRNYTTEKTKECKVEDLILTVRAPVGAVAKSIHNACIGRGVCAIRNNKESVNEFIYQFLLNYETKWSSLEQGSTFTAVSGLEIKKLKLNLPSLKEQTKIANFLSSIDKKIELTTKELNSTKEFKKALLQQMFV